MKRSGSFFIFINLVALSCLFSGLLVSSVFAQDECDNTYFVVSLSDSFVFENEVVVRADIPENQTKVIGCINVQQSGFYQINSVVSYSNKQDNESFYFQVCSKQTLSCVNACNPNLGPYNVVVDETDVADTTVRNGGTFYLTEGDNILTVNHYAQIAYELPRYLNGPDSIDGAQSIHMKAFKVDYVDHVFDVDVMETPSITAVNPGEEYQYRLVVKNIEKSNVFFVNLKNALPPYVSPVSYTLPPTSFDGDTLFWTFDSLASGDSIIVDVDVRVDDSPPIRPLNLINRTWVTGSCDYNAENGMDTSVVVILPPVFYDLDVQKTTQTDSLFRGQTVNYDIQLKNSGPDTASNITIVDLIPSNLTFLNTALTPQRVTPDSIYWQIDTLAVGDSIKFGISTKVNDDGFVVPSVISNKTVTVSENDINATNDESIASVRVVPRRADISVVKSADQDSIFKEKDFEYSMQLQNAGPDSATNVVLKDFLPSNLLIKSFEPEPEIINGDVIQWQIDTLAVNEVREFKVFARADTSIINAPATLVNRVVAEVEADPDTTNNSAIATINIIPRQYDLFVEKTADRDSIYKEQNYSYEINVENAGPDTASHIIVMDIISQGIIVNTFEPEPLRVEGDTIFWLIDTLAIGEQAFFRIGASADTGRISIPTELINSVVIESENDAVLENNQDSVVVRVVPRRYDLSVIKTASRDSIFKEQSFGYQILVANAGPDTASRITVMDVKSPDIIANSFEPEPLRVVGDTIFWFVDSLDIGEQRLFRVGARVDTNQITVPSELTNLAIIESENDVNPINNIDSVIVRVVPPVYDVSVIKTASRDSIFREHNYSYLITVENSGPDTARHIIVQDIKSPDIITYSYEPEPVRVNGDTIFWRIDSLALGEHRNFRVGARADTNQITVPTDLSNVAVVKSEHDVNAVNDSATAVVHVVPPVYDLTVVKTTSRDSIFKEQNYSYLITVENTGPDTARGIVLKDIKSPDIIAHSYEPEPASIDGDTIFWKINSLIAGEQRTFRISAHADTNRISVPTKLTNLAIIDSEHDVNRASDTDTAVVRVVPPVYDLSVVKTASRDSIFKEQNYSYQITVANAGPDTARRIIVKDIMSPDIIANSFNPEPVRIEGDTVFWYISSLAVREQRLFRVGARADTNRISVPAELNNLALIESEHDVNIANDQDAAVVRVVPPVYDLSVTKTATRDSIFKEQNYSYQITVANAGPDTARNIIVKDVKSADIVAFAYEPEPTKVNGDTIFWHIDSLSIGQQRSFRVSARADTNLIAVPAELTNLAIINSEHDINPNNNEDIATVKVVHRRYDILITKTVSADSVFPGQGFRYTLSVTNAGPDTALSVGVKDVVPEQANLLIFDPEPYQITPDTIYWRIGLLKPNETTVFNISARADSSKAGLPRQITNTGLVTSRRDFDKSNDSSTITNFTVRKRSDLQIIKSASVDSVIEGGSFEYSLTVENVGRDVAENIVLWDLSNSLITTSNYSLTPDHTQQDTLFWLFDSLSAGDLFQIEYTAQAPDTVPTTPYEIPSWARIFAENDVNPDNDFSEFIIIIKPQDDCIVFDRNVLIPQRGELLEIEFELSTQRMVSIDVYDVSGYRVGNLRKEFLEPGVHTITWDGKNKNGRDVGSGTYLITFKSGRLICYKKVIVVH